jgi:hypothetical protein
MIEKSETIFFVSPHLCPHFLKPCGVACKVFPRLDAASPVLESLLEAFVNFCVQSSASIACNCSWLCWWHEISFPSLPGWVLENKKDIGWHGSLKGVGQLLWPYWLENLHRQRKEFVMHISIHVTRTWSACSLQWDELIGPWVQDDCLFQTVALFLEHTKGKFTPRKQETTMQLQFRRSVTCFEQEISCTVSKRTLRVWLTTW